MTPARLHLLQALSRRRRAKRALEAAEGLTAIREAAATIERTTRCAVACLEEYRAGRDVAAAMPLPVDPHGIEARQNC